MYKILLCCVSGVTTNKLVNAVKESAKQKDIKVMCWAVGSKSVGLSWADADCVLLAPQSASELSKIEEMVHGVIPCALINDGDFASMSRFCFCNYNSVYFKTSACFRKKRWFNNCNNYYECDITLCFTYKCKWHNN